MNRREFIAGGVVSLATAKWLSGEAFAAPAAQHVTPKVEEGVHWYNPQDWGIEGKGWNDTERYYDRLPKKAHGVVRDVVWNLSRHSAGMVVRFASDSPTIKIRYKLLSSRVAMTNMSAMGTSGVDLYGQLPDGRWSWVACSKPDKQEINAVLVTGLKPGYRAYMAYLPLYNGVESLEFGVNAGSWFVAQPPRTEKPIVFYGTSILHGASASRPGMPHAAILGRRLNKPFINLGFSGNALMEPEIASLLTELDPAVYVIDALPNMVPTLVKERAENFLRKLREAKPKIPIVCVEDRTYGDAPFIQSRRDRNDGSRKEFKIAYDKLIKEGMTGLSYVEGENLLGDDFEATADGSHPSDLGFWRQAAVLEPVIRKALAGG